MRLKAGLDEALEEQADALIFPLPKNPDGSWDHAIVSVYRQKVYYRRTAFMTSGVADGAVLRGSYRVAQNSRQYWLNDHERGVHRVPIPDPDADALGYYW